MRLELSPSTGRRRSQSSNASNDDGEPSVLLAAHQLGEIAAVLVIDPAVENHRAAAKDLAAAHEQLSRIQEVRDEQWAEIDLNQAFEQVSNHLGRLASLDRYERYALTKRLRALKRLEEG